MSAAAKRIAVGTAVAALAYPAADAGIVKNPKNTYAATGNALKDDAPLAFLEGTTWGLGDAGLISLLDTKRTLTSGAQVGAATGAVTGALKGLIKTMNKYNDDKYLDPWVKQYTDTDYKKYATGALTGALAGAGLGSLQGVLMNLVDPKAAKVGSGKSAGVKRYGRRKNRKPKGRKGKRHGKKH